MITLRGAPATYRVRHSRVRVANVDWLAHVAGVLTNPSFRAQREAVVDLSNIDFIPLFEVVELFTTILAYGQHLERLAIDVVGNITELLPLRDLIQLEATGARGARIESSRRAYRLLAFLESIDTRSVLQRCMPSAAVGYSHLSPQQVHRSFYAAKAGDHGVINALYPVLRASDATAFIQRDSIDAWRSAMADRFEAAPLLRLDELWRVFCHELAANVTDHSQGAGLIATRVIQTGAPTLHDWCRWSYTPALHPMLESSMGAVLELTIADAGVGLVQNLQQLFETRAGAAHKRAADVLALAFDELGSSRGEGLGALLGRHALSRLLRLAALYGGAVVIRSDGEEVTYVGTKPLLRLPRRLGYEPHDIVKLPAAFPGAHIQVLLPLSPTMSQKRHAPVHRLTLPRSFRTDPRFPMGHLVPVAEYLGNAAAETIGGQKTFLAECERLAAELLLTRAPDEPVTFDFSLVDWTPQQLEAFLHIFQNVIQARPVIAVELPVRLAKQVSQLEVAAVPSTLKGALDGILPERDYLGTYSLFSAVILALDTERHRYLFGVGNLALSEAILSLIDDPASIQEIMKRCSDTAVTVSDVVRVLSRNQYHFGVAKGRWYCYWDAETLEREATRAIATNFDAVAAATNAWRGREPHVVKKTGKRRVFHLPWDDSWLTDFLESSRILSRERYIDDVAQRLVARLRRRFIADGAASVVALFCATSPALLLATAMVRWWVGPRPKVVDVGEQILTSSKTLPSMVGGGTVLIVQDIVDTGSVTRELIGRLSRQNVTVNAIVAFVRMTTVAPRAAIATSPDDWAVLPGSDIPTHAVVTVARPAEAAEQERDELSAEAYWIEPRTLRAYRFRALRQEFKTDRDSEMAGRARYFTHAGYLAAFDPADGPCLVRSGHFVYGRRHYMLSVDVQQLFESAAGTEIVRWIADVCENDDGRRRGSWETDDGFSLRDEVTAIIMPLHSRIHYLLPKLQKELARRNRRVPFWLLDASLFMSDGATYRLPHQLRRQIVEAAEAPGEGPGRSKLRFLILDDAISSGRTIQTILATLQDAIEHAVPTRERTTAASPVAWLRYFAILNQMTPALNKYWHNVRGVGHPATPFVFEEYAPMIGLRSYEEETCPACLQRAALEHLARVAEGVGGDSVKSWALSERLRLGPRLLEAPGNRVPVVLNPPLKLVGEQPRPAFHVDAAILEFERLMRLSYPVRHVLKIVSGGTWPEGVDAGTTEAYEDLRGWVLEWCIRHMRHRTLIGTETRSVLMAALQREVSEFTPLVPRMFMLLAAYETESEVRLLLLHAFEHLMKIERDDAIDEGERVRALDVLEVAIDAFLLARSIPGDGGGEGAGRGGMQSNDAILQLLANAADETDASRQSFARNLILRHSRPVRHASPDWGLLVIAEALYRGRDESLPIDGNHLLLPRLLIDVLKYGVDIESRRLLRGSLTLFAAALDELVPYATRDFGGNIQRLCGELLAWLRAETGEVAFDEPPDALRDLSDDLEFGSSFCETFNELFHQRFDSLRTLAGTHGEESKAKVDVIVVVPTDIEADRMLTSVQRLLIALRNWCIEPIRKESSEQVFVSKITVERDAVAPRVKVRLLTSFADASVTQARIDASSHSHADISFLERFGVKIGRWERPMEVEQADYSFAAALGILIPVGFGARRL